MILNSVFPPRILLCHQSNQSIWFNFSSFIYTSVISRPERAMIANGWWCMWNLTCPRRKNDTIFDVLPLSFEVLVVISSPSLIHSITTPWEDHFHSFHILSTSIRYSVISQIVSIAHSLHALDTFRELHHHLRETQVLQLSNSNFNS